MTNYAEFDDDVRFDRLVDGELSSTEYQQLLASLDDHPDGWRQLALRFLESQAWGAELRAVRHEAEPQCRPVARPPSRFGWIPVTLAAAASFLAAFGLGIAWKATTDPAPMVAKTVEPGIAPQRTEEDVAPLEEDEPWGRVTLVMDRDDGSSEEFDVPVFRLEDARTGQAFDDFTAQLLKVREAFERAGYQARRDIRWTPVEVEPGTRVFVPLGDVEIIPAARRVYQ